MSPSRILLAPAFAAALACGTAGAATRFGDNVSFSGFGTVGVVSTNNGDAIFSRDGSGAGASTQASWNVDSKLGVQTDIKANDWLSGTVQVLAEQRYDPGVKARFEWAFVRLQPLDGLTVRLGRTSPNVFMISDSRNVGYANPMVRLPNEAYFLNSLKRLAGIDASYRLPVAGQSLTVTAFGGNGTIFTNGRGELDTKKVRGLNAVLETGIGSFRIGKVKTDTHIPGASVGLPFELVAPYDFSGVGYQYDEGNVLVNAEYVKRKVTGDFNGLDAKGWYLLGGYRFGNWMPYAMYARTDSAPLSKTFAVSGDQRTVALGVRWDLVSGAALKLQAERVDPKGTLGTSFSNLSPLPIAKTTAFSVALDFVF